MSFDLPSAGTMNVIQGITGLVTGIGHLFGARQETAAGEHNAQILEQQARAERESQKLLEVQKRRQTKSVIGSQIAQTGASGFRYTGDPITIMIDSLANSELDIAIDRYNTESRARGLESKAQVERFDARRKATRSIFSASESFLGVAANQFLSNQTLGGTNLGPGRTSYGIKVPSRYVPPR